MNHQPTQADSWPSSGLLNQLNNLPVLAKQLAEGVLQGIHPGIQRGTGIEFNQYRGYQPGDPVSQIDWKLFARSDRYFIREAERESELRVNLVIDNSRSMDFVAPQSSLFHRKIDYAKVLLACLGWIAQKQGDSVSLTSLGTGEICHLNASSGQSHWKKLCVALKRLTSKPSLQHDFIPLLRLMRPDRPGLTFIVTDGYQTKNELMDFIKSIAASRMEIRLVLISSQFEQTLPLATNVRLKDLETGEMIKLGKNAARLAKTQLEKNRQTFLAEIKSMHIQAHQISMDQPVTEALRTILLQKKAIPEHQQGGQD